MGDYFVKAMPEATNQTEKEMVHSWNGPQSIYPSTFPSLLLLRWGSQGSQDPIPAVSAENAGGWGVILWSSRRLIAEPHRGGRTVALTLTAAYKLQLVVCSRLDCPAPKNKSNFWHPRRLLFIFPFVFITSVDMTELYVCKLKGDMYHLLFLPPQVKQWMEI